MQTHVIPVFPHAIACFISFINLLLLFLSDCQSAQLLQVVISSKYLITILVKFLSLGITINVIDYLGLTLISIELGWRLLPGT